MADDLQRCTYAAGDIIIAQGEPAMNAYLIEKGRAKVTLVHNSIDVQVAELGAEEIFGETAFFKGSDYGATVTALTEMSVVVITPEVLDQKIQACDPLIRAIVRMLVTRLRKTNTLLVS